MTLLDHFGPADAAAVLFLAIGALAIGFRIESKAPGTKPSVTVLMAAYCHRWMREFVTREPRVFDASILSSLRQSTTFFASTCVIAIGGVLALMGNADRLVGLFDDLPVDLPGPAPTVVQIKLLLPALFLITAFLRFVWSNRLFGYCSVVMAAVPNDVTHPETDPTARRAARLNIRAAWNFNRGLRAMYFALAALAWLIGALALAAAAGVTFWVLWSWEFASQSRRALTDSADSADTTE